jgi:hypothetical protein
MEVNSRHAVHHFDHLHANISQHRGTMQPSLCSPLPFRYTSVREFSSGSGNEGRRQRPFDFDGGAAPTLRAQAGSPTALSLRRGLQRRRKAAREGSAVKQQRRAAKLVCC